MHQEGVGLIEAMGAFEEQMHEVIGVLDEMLRARRGAEKVREKEKGAEMEWGLDWEFGRERTRGRRKMVG